MTPTLSPTTYPRKIRKVIVSGSIFTNILKTGTPETTIDNPLPADAILVGADYQQNSDQFHLYFHSNDFLEMGDGLWVQEVQPKFRIDYDKHMDCSSYFTT